MAYKLLTVGNPKTVKGTGFGYLTAVLHLAPASLSGRNVCPAATKGCIAACLNTAGRGGISAGGTLTHDDVAAGKRNAIQEARIRRTRFLYQNRAGFIAALEADIRRLAADAAAHGLRAALRLNGTSDLDWHGMAPSVVALAASLGVALYDYTKVPNRRKRAGVHGYSVTLSLTEANDALAADWLRAGHNVAVVFAAKRGAALPPSYVIAGEAFRVIDGDEHDLRFLDPAGVIVGLRAKGNAKKDTTGFVRPV
jgi:hypothetical protein